MYHNELRHAVEKLGYPVEGGSKNGMFEIGRDGRETVEAWSARHMKFARLPAI